MDAWDCGPWHRESSGATRRPAPIWRRRWPWTDTSRRHWAVEALVYRLRGHFREVDAGTCKAGEASSLKLTAALEYYKLEVDGETVHEIDVINMKRVINGVNQMEERRRALGL
ncbi:MAG: phage major tail tube protein [Bryobacterales bacterium]|nr:phage major tail tube protein [Bryobacterales bacterium]